MIEDPDACWHIVERRDARFDGRFIVAVRTTRIYCRPSCPALTPKRRNVELYATAAAAQQSGYRACKRCRPDASPGSPDWNLRSDAVGRAMRLIADGVVDREGVGGLARRVGYSERHLTRVLTSELGAGPLAIARAQRAQTARTLIESTDLRMADVAFGAGFASIRQFNDTVREVYASTPSELRARARRHEAPQPGRVTVRLAHRAPFAAAPLLAFLTTRALPGVEAIDDAGDYHRTLELPHGGGRAHVGVASDHLVAALDLDDLADLAPAVRRLRDVFDLDVDPTASDEHLARDPRLRASVRRTPGLRVPGTPNPTELVVRAVIGQQISVAGARTITGRLVAALGRPCGGDDPALTHHFPTADAIATSDLDGLGLTRSRRETLRRVCDAIAAGALDLGVGADRAAARAALLAIPGIGPWTVEYVAMRALRDPDALMPTDLGVRQGATALGLPDDPGALAEHACRWRPWRAYAQMHLWHSLTNGALR